MVDKERLKCPVSNCQKPEEAATRAVKHVFEILGIDVDNPKQVENFRRGLRFGEDMYLYSKRAKLAVLFSMISLATAAIWYSLWGKP